MRWLCILCLIVVCCVQDTGNVIDLVGEKRPERTGLTPANVVLDKIVAFPIAGEKDTVVLRNIGGNSADLNGWVLIDGDGSEFVLESSKDCPQFGTLLPAEKLEITTKSDQNPCGFSFNLGFQ